MSSATEDPWGTIERILKDNMGNNDAEEIIVALKQVINNKPKTLPKKRKRTEEEINKEIQEAINNGTYFEKFMEAFEEAMRICSKYEK